MRLNLILKQGMAIVFGFMLLSFSLLAQAENSQSAVSNEANALTYEPQLENQRDPNQYCAKCHKLDSNAEQSGGDLHFGKFHGTHLSKLSPNTGKPINCVNCHGNISENHRRGVKDVMRFNGFGKAKNPELERTPQEQNQVCFSCHKPDKLREVFWPHDVHANKMACANCHKLHPETEPMKATEQKDRVKLCVDCHSRIHQKNAEKLKAKDNK